MHNIGRLSSLQRICASHGIVPTYLCTYDVIKSREFERFVSGQSTPRNLEIGAHLHPWANPPLIDLDQPGNTPFVTDYSLDVIEEKMSTLVRAITERYGAPRAYRAGRFSFSPGHITLLRALGIECDSSVTPYVSWGGADGFAQGGQNYRRFPVEPFYWAPDGGTSSNYASSSILEVPVTILPTARWVSRDGAFDRLLRWSRGFQRLTEKLSLTSVGWLRPLPTTTVVDFRHVIEQGIRYRLPVLVMFLHSNELHESFNPYFRDKQSVERLLRLLDDTFALVNEYEMESISLSGYANIRKVAAETGKELG